jgi:hypothetical protein
LRNIKNTKQTEQVLMKEIDTGKSILLHPEQRLVLI